MTMNSRRLLCFGVSIELDTSLPLLSFFALIILYLFTRFFSHGIFLGFFFSELKTMSNLVPILFSKRVPNLKGWF